MLNQVFNFGHWVCKDLEFSNASVSDLNKYLVFYKFLYLSTLQNISREHLLDFQSILSGIDDIFEVGMQKDAPKAFLKLLDIFDIGISVFLPNYSSITDVYFQGIYKRVKNLY